MARKSDGSNLAVSAAVSVPDFVELILIITSEDNMLLRLSGTASGMYFYRLQAGSVTVTKSAIVLKVD